MFGMMWKWGLSLLEARCLYMYAKGTRAMQVVSTMKATTPLGIARIDFEVL